MRIRQCVSALALCENSTMRMNDATERMPVCKSACVVSASVCVEREREKRKMAFLRKEECVRGQRNKKNKRRQKGWETLIFALTGSPSLPLSVFVQEQTQMNETHPLARSLSVPTCNKGQPFISSAPNLGAYQKPIFLSCSIGQ